MKIEIELHELETLRKTMNEQEAEINNLRSHLKNLEEEELRRHSVIVAEKICNAVLQAIFKKLGFENNTRFYDGLKFRNLEYYYGKDWMKHKDLEVTLEANITKEFKRAFINMGIKTK